MEYDIKKEYNKKTFIEELNQIIAKNGKSKLVRPFGSSSKIKKQTEIINNRKKCKTVIDEIKASGSSKASQKDEVALMRAMLNDPTFACTNVDSKGNPVVFNPCET